MSEARRAAAVELIGRSDAVLRRTARRHSICAEDAEDAYQRALEIMLTKAPPISGERLLRWMQVVTKREAMSVRRQRERMLGTKVTTEDGDELDPLDLVPADSPSPGDRAERSERVSRSGEALRALKPNEVRALSLKAQGFTYEEIGELTGWTHTKINRCMAEGRKRFMRIFGEIEDGSRCESFADALSALADGLESAELAEVRVHLKGCAHCRAALAIYRGLPERVLSALTPAAVTATPGGAERIGSLTEKLISAGDRARELAAGAMGRGAGEGVTPLAATGGTRGVGMAGLAKLLAVCGATAAGGTACVATGIVDRPHSLGGERDEPAIEQTAQPPAAPTGEPPATAVIDQPPAPAPDPVTPQEQTQQQFSFEPQAATASGGGTSQFGVGGSQGGGGSGGGGSGGGQFGFQ